MRIFLVNFFIVILFTCNTFSQLSNTDKLDITSIEFQNSINNSQNSKSKLFDAGIGFGSSYGLMGINLTVNPFNNFSLFAGAGSDEKFDRFFWSAGLRYYVLNHTNSFRPRITFYYGLNSFVEYTRTSESGMILGKYKELDEGMSVGAGFRWLFIAHNSLGIDFDVYYALTSDETPFMYPDKYSINPVVTNKWSISFGIRYEFDLWN